MRKVPKAMGFFCVWTACVALGGCGSETLEGNALTLDDPLLPSRAFRLEDEREGLRPFSDNSRVLSRQDVEAQRLGVSLQSVVDELGLWGPILSVPMLLYPAAEGGGYCFVFSQTGLTAIVYVQDDGPGVYVLPADKRGEPFAWK